MKEHAVHRLFEHRLSQSTRPFQARGKKVERCPRCRIQVQHCICNLAPELYSDAGFLLLFYDDEILKPSNSGKLIADLIDNTFAYIWQRTEVNPEIVEILEDDQWFPVVVFPSEYAEPGRKLFQDELTVPKNKKPLFVMLDGTWREAKKMFRKSPYLESLPVLSITPVNLSTFQIRKSVREYQLATAEVAACALACAGESKNARVLNAWFELFNYRYQHGKTAKNLGNPNSEAELMDAIRNLED